MKKFKAAVATFAAMMAFSSFSGMAYAQEKVKVTFWHAMNGPHQEQMTKMVEAFNASQDEVEVVEQNQGDYRSLQQSIMAAGRSGGLPTMTQLTASNTPDFMANNLLQPLDELLVAENGFTDELKSDIFEGFMSGVTYDGKVYAVPFAKSVRLLFVNRDLLDQAGVDVPKTWAEVRELGEKLKEAGVDKPAMGLENSLSMEVETMARQNGAVWISDDLKTVDIGSEKAVEPVQFLADLIHDGYARTAGEDKYFSGPFSRGEAAVYIGSSAGLAHVLPGVKENNINFETAEIPVYNDGAPLTMFAGNDLGVFASATPEEQAGAAKFMAYLLQPENTASWAAATGYLPVTKSGLETDVWKKYIEENPYAEPAAKELAYGKSQPGYAGSGEVFTELETSLEKIVASGDTDVKSEMERIQELVKKLLQLD